jgi:hypothetical protein
MRLLKQEDSMGKAKRSHFRGEKVSKSSRIMAKANRKWKANALRYGIHKYTDAQFADVLLGTNIQNTNGW